MEIVQYQMREIQKPRFVPLERRRLAVSERKVSVIGYAIVQFRGVPDYQQVEGPVEGDK
jgi:hypothetical protein